MTTTDDDNDGGTIANPNGPDGTLSLREALEVANEGGGGANITFDIPGDSAANPQTITLMSALPAITGSVTIAGPGADELTVSGNDEFQVFDVTQGSVASIAGLTIAHGFSDTELNGYGNTEVEQGDSGLAAGGGVLNNGTLTLASDLLTDNAATNAAQGDNAGGGALYNTGTLTINACSFTNNSATATGGGFSAAKGGAIYNEGNAVLTMTDSTLSGNTATDSFGRAHAEGGAMELEGNATITGTTISGNSAIAGGGAGGLGGGIDADAAIEIADSTVAGNTVTVTGSGTGTGGGISDDGSSDNLALTNCTIASNTINGSAVGEGGGLGILFHSTATLTNCTLAGNADNFATVNGSGGGGIYDQNGSTLSLTNTIVAGNTETAGGNGADVSNDGGAGTISSDDHNLIGSGDGSGLNATGGATLGAQKTATLSIAEDNDQPLGGIVYLEGQPGDGNDATFVRDLYRNLLGREPEPLGEAFWVGLIEGGGNQSASTQLGRDRAVADILNSPEYKEHLVFLMYETLLDRAPEPSGLAFWTAKLGQPGTPGGATGSSDEKFVLAAIAGSQEYFTLHGGTNGDWISALYKDLLGRAPDAGGLAGWEQQATSQPDDRDGLVRDILDSPEAEHKLLNAFSPLVDPSIPPPGAPAGGPYALAEITGGGWQNLYFQDKLSTAALDALLAELQAGNSYDEVIAGMLGMAQYFGPD